MWGRAEALIAETQEKQDRFGNAHPGETMVATFACPLFLRWYLKAKAINGLSFEKYNGEWYGVYRAQK